MYKLPPVEARKLWVRKLRSGRYKKGIKKLRSRDEHGNVRYCGLGVACEAMRQAEGKNALPMLNADGVYAYYDGKFGYAPEKLVTWLGLSSNEGGFVDSNGRATSLVLQNDQVGLSLKEIADLIETNPKNLFKEC